MPLTGRILGRETALLFQVMGVSASASTRHGANDNDTLHTRGLLRGRRQSSQHEPRTGWGLRCRASAIAARRSLAFASDDEGALTLWTALTNSSGHRTRDLLRLLVSSGAIEEDEAPSVGPCPRRTASVGAAAATGHLRPESHRASLFAAIIAA